MIILGPRCDNGNVQLKFMGKMKATLTSNGWSAKTYIDVFGGGGGGCRPLIFGRDMMPQLSF